MRPLVWRPGPGAGDVYHRGPRDGIIVDQLCRCFRLQTHATVRCRVIRHHRIVVQRDPPGFIEIRDMNRARVVVQMCRKSFYLELAFRRAFGPAAAAFRHDVAVVADVPAPGEL